MLELLDVFSQSPCFSRRVDRCFLVALGAPADHVHVHLEIQACRECFFAGTGEHDAAHGRVAREAVKDGAVLVPHAARVLVYFLFLVGVGGWAERERGGGTVCRTHSVSRAG